MNGLTIDEAAQRMGISKDTLRYYEKEGLLPPIAKGANGHRRYSEDDLGWVSSLQLLRGTGMPIRDMKLFVELTTAGDHTLGERVELLSRYRVALKERMAADRERLKFLDYKIDVYSGLLALQSAEPADITG